MNNINAFNARFPIELVAEWVKDNGIEDGAITSTQDVIIHNVELDMINGYLIIDAVLEQKVLN